ncbi:MAG: hypothetical protein M0036_22400 [Desulfobacteraceae bacterium]|nr:hypothetical protein [Desulfobacteraceae bacterium]
MGKFFKILCYTALMVLVVFAALADRVKFPGWLEGLNVALYLRLVALTGLIIAVFTSWGFRRKVEASQRYRRSQQVIAEAEAAAQRKQGALEQLQVRLEAQFVEKEKKIRDEMEGIKAGYIEQIKALKEQNLKLKETVSNLMQAVKQKR